VKKKFALYILRLLAGKLENICTAFPLTTFSAKKFKINSLKISRQKYVNTTACKTFSGTKKKLPILSKFNFG